MRVLTPTQYRMLAVLSDGMPHMPEELHKCLFDNGNDIPISNIAAHLVGIRKVLRLSGKDIAYSRRDRVYCLVRRVASEE